MVDNQYDPQSSEHRSLRGRLRDLFRERQLLVRSGSQVRTMRLPSWVQVSAVVLLLGAAGWVGFATYKYTQHAEIVAQKERRIRENRLAYQSVLVQVAEYRKKFDAITKELETNHSEMLQLAEKNSTLKENLEAVQSRLATVAEERRAAEARRERLRERLQALSEEMRGLSTEKYSLVRDMKNLRRRLVKVTATRDAAVKASDGLREKVTALKEEVQTLESSQATVVKRLTDLAGRTVTELEDTLAMTDLNVDKMLSRLQNGDYGVGGPFVKLDPEAVESKSLRTDLAALNRNLNRWEGLHRMLKRLPLAEPLDHYHITSGYGQREDPMNGRMAMHYGLDLGAVEGSKVYVPAPGEVVDVGWNGQYGRFVEIDHGMDIHTRYGHLKEPLVELGEEVAYRDKIALVGNSGRSTGTHLHYEVVVDGTRVDPYNFIKAGRYVFKEQ